MPEYNGRPSIIYNLCNHWVVTRVCEHTEFEHTTPQVRSSTKLEGV
jgi:hypothetical protein